MSNDVKKFLDEEGVKVLWNQINLNDYPNNETLIAVINAIDETKADKNELIQSDWNQNDITALDYIKNKPVEPTEMDAFALVIETGLIEPAADENGALLTDENNKFIII